MIGVTNAIMHVPTWLCRTCISTKSIYGNVDNLNISLPNIHFIYRDLSGLKCSPLQTTANSSVCVGSILGFKQCGYVRKLGSSFSWVKVFPMVFPPILLANMDNLSCAENGVKPHYKQHFIYIPFRFAFHKLILCSSWSLIGIQIL